MTLTTNFKVEDLSVGNWYYQGTKPTKLTGYDLAQYASYLEGDRKDEFYGRFKGILIDGPWLRKFGFFDYGDGYYEKELSKEKLNGIVKKVYITWTAGGNDIVSVSIEYDHDKEGVNTGHFFDMPHVRYVHQLQNLIKNLTGEDETNK